MTPASALPIVLGKHRDHRCEERPPADDGRLDRLKLEAKVAPNLLLGRFARMLPVELNDSRFHLPLHYPLGQFVSPLFLSCNLVYPNPMADDFLQGSGTGSTGEDRKNILRLRGNRGTRELSCGRSQRHLTMGICPERSIPLRLYSRRFPPPDALEVWKPSLPDSQPNLPARATGIRAVIVFQLLRFDG